MLCIQRTEHRRGISLIFPSLLSLKWWPKVIKGIKFLSRWELLWADGSRHRSHCEAGELPYMYTSRTFKSSVKWAKTLNIDCCKLNFFQPFRTSHCSKARRWFKTSCSNSWNALKILHKSRRKISFSLPIRIASMRPYHCARMSEKQPFLFLTAIQHAG